MNVRIRNTNRLMAQAPALATALQNLIDATSRYGDLTTAEAAKARRDAKRAARKVLAFALEDHQ